MGIHTAKNEKMKNDCCSVRQLRGALQTCASALLDIIRASMPLRNWSGETAAGGRRGCWTTEGQRRGARRWTRGTAWWWGAVTPSPSTLATPGGRCSCSRVGRPSPRPIILLAAACRDFPAPGSPLLSHYAPFVSCWSAFQAVANPLKVAAGWRDHNLCRESMVSPWGSGV